MRGESQVQPASAIAEAADSPPPAEAHLEPLAYKIAEASQITRISRSRLYELMSGPNPKLESVKIGKTRLISVTSLKKLLREGC